MTDQSPSEDYLLFEVRDQIFALPASAVVEAVAPRPITRLPFVPDYIEGLVNVNEQVLPQVHMRCLTFAESNQNSESNDELLVVDTPGAPCALRVDRIVGRHSVTPETLQALPDGSDLPARMLFTAQLLFEGRMALVMDLARLAAVVVGQEAEPGKTGLLGRLRADDRGRQGEVLSCIVVSVRGERYALELSDIHSVVDSAAATPLPGAPRGVEGITVVRGEALLVLNMAELLDRGNHLSMAPHLVVIERGETRYGLHVDGIESIITFEKSALRMIDEAASTVVGMLVHGGQVLGLLKPERLISDEGHARLMPFAPQRRQNQDVHDDARVPVLLFVLGSEKYCLPLESVRRVVGYMQPEIIDHAAGSWVSGAVHIEGAIIPVVDLAAPLQLGGSSGTGALVILASAQGELAIPVQEVADMVEIPGSAIEEASKKNGGFIEAVARVGNNLVSMLSISSLASLVVAAPDPDQQVNMT